MKTNIQIKQMNITDFPQLYSLWKKTGLRVSAEKTEFFQTKLAIALNPNACLVLVDNKKIIGSVLGTFNGKRGWIYHLAIDSDFQNTGYGSKLLSVAEQTLKKQGARRICLGVSYTNLKVMPFYEKFGYQVVSDALWLRKNI